MRKMHLEGLWGTGYLVGDERQQARILNSQTPHPKLKTLRSFQAGRAHKAQEKKAQIDATDCWGRTALMWAAEPKDAAIPRPSPLNLKLANSTHIGIANRLTTFVFLAIESRCPHAL